MNKKLKSIIIITILVIFMLLGLLSNIVGISRSSTNDTSYKTNLVQI